MSARRAVPAAPSVGRLRPLGIDEVTVTGGVWSQRQAVNGHSSLAHIEYWLERSGWLQNFDLAASGGLPEGRRGREFTDSDVYKYLEALAWEIGRTADPDLDERFRRIATRVASAQEPDGYLNTMFGRAGQAPRWSDMEWGHELYCLGHLFQAAVARERSSPGSDDGLLQVAVRAADLVCAEFGPDGRHQICGHAEVELGLVEMGRLLGESRYVEQAAIFVERHGAGTLAEIEFGRSYFQDTESVRAANVLSGHAVRANYLAAAAVDVGVELGDPELVAAIEKQWDATVRRRTYITGGQGSHHQDEAFGEDWELPPDRAYSETCAGVGSIMLSWRLLLATGDPRYADLIERTLFNVVATSPGPDGVTFFYANPLHQRVAGKTAEPDEVSARAFSSVRAPWFEVSCCPSNVARTLATLGSYAATADDSGIQIHQYMPSRIHTRLGSGEKIDLELRTEYPRSGRVEVRVLTDAHAEWTLSLRVPSWASGARLGVAPPDGAPGDWRSALPGVIDVTRRFAAGEIVVLDMPMTARWSEPDPRIDAVRGCVAIERGPEVMCVEDRDLPADWGSVENVEVVTSEGIREEGDKIVVRVRTASIPEAAWPYGAPASRRRESAETDAPLVPYNTWGERGPTTMRVWIPAV